MTTFGKKSLARFNLGGSLRASSSPKGVRGGAIDWGTVPVASEDTLLLDEREVKTGERCLRYGSILVRITASSERHMYGPYDRNANDGRQSMNLGDVVILDETICESDLNAQPRLFDSGQVFKARLLVSGDGQPTWEQFARALRVSLITD